MHQEKVHDASLMHSTKVFSPYMAFAVLSLTVLRLAPDGIATLKPGGMHLMLMKPSATLKAGTQGVVELKLVGGGELLGKFEVRKPEL
jgi:copper(I)-binding protein